MAKQETKCRPVYAVVITKGKVGYPVGEWMCLSFRAMAEARLQDVRGRAHDVLWMSSLAFRGAMTRGNDRANFKLTLARKGSRQRLVILRVVADSDGVTIGFPEDF